MHFSKIQWDLIFVLKMPGLLIYALHMRTSQKMLLERDFTHNYKIGLKCRFPIESLCGVSSFDGGD